jgi:two-component system CheB/CheR fusion protein
MNSPGDNPEFETLVEYLKRSRGFDFTAYKRPGLMRRVQRRMETIGVDSFTAYLDFLEVHPDEFTHLFNTILINVTAFFRDPPAWARLSADTIPHIVASKRATDAIRVWSAGCASGEEAYTVAMVLAENLGAEAAVERVKIYATDVDEDALNKARLGSYTTHEVGGVPAPMLEKYFEHVGDRYTFHKDLRRTVIFGRHDLIQDAPISRVDLLVCRNAMMYFNAEAQSRLLARFHFALNDTGFLFLGKAEMLLMHSNTFTPVDLKCRIFSKVPKVNLRDRLLIMAQTGRDDYGENNVLNHVRMREAVFDIDTIAQVVIDLQGNLVLANELARTMFNLGFKDIGRPIRDLEICYRPVELRAHLEQVVADRRPVLLKDVAWQPNADGQRALEVRLVPLADVGGALLGVKVTFTDVSRYKELQDELQRSNQELETAYEEIQTSNEELQSTNEELETTNEELQSTNEELETMNEELQSSNEELRTMNEELHQRTDELDQVNAFLESILTSLRVGVVVLDRSQHVQAWNHKAEDLWGMREDEVRGKHFLSLDIGLPVEQLKQQIRAALAGETMFSETVVPAINRRGKAIECKVSVTPLSGPRQDSHGAILLMEDGESGGGAGWPPQGT